MIPSSTTNSTILYSDSGLARRDVIVIGPVKGQQVAGWITSTQTYTDGQIFYGFFPTIEQAKDWAKNLIDGTTIQPVYHPSFNAG